MYHTCHYRLGKPGATCKLKCPLSANITRQIYLDTDLINKIKVSLQALKLTKSIPVEKQGQHSIGGRLILLLLISASFLSFVFYYMC